MERKERVGSDAEPTSCYGCGAQLDEFEVAIALANNTTIGLCDRCADDQAYLDDAGLERGAREEVYPRES